MTVGAALVHQLVGVVARHNWPCMDGSSRVRGRRVAGRARETRAGARAKMSWSRRMAAWGRRLMPPAISRKLTRFSLSLASVPPAPPCCARDGALPREGMTAVYRVDALKRSSGSATQQEAPAGQALAHTETRHTHTHVHEHMSRIDTPTRVHATRTCEAETGRGVFRRANTWM